MVQSYKEHLVIIIALEHYNPLGMIRTFGENGIHPIYIGVKYRTRIASASKYVGTFHSVDDIQGAYDCLLNNYGNVAQETGKKPIVIFADDDVMEPFDNNYTELKEKFITFNAGKDGRVVKFMEKEEIMNCAKRHGIPVLDSQVVKVGDIPKNLTYPVVTKAVSPISGAWKGDFHVCENEQQLREMMSTIKAPEIMIQPYVDKKAEITFEGFSYNHGKGMFTGVECKYRYAIKGYYSPLHDTYMPNDKELLKKLNSMLEEVGFEGIWEIEFLVDKNDNLWFLEVNFRNSTWSYASTVAGNPLPILWCEAMLTGKCPEPKPFEPFLAMVEPIDYSKRVEEGRCTLPEWLADFKSAKCTYYYDAQDMAPWKVLVDNWDKLK